MTPAERAALKEERSRAKREENVQVDISNFVAVDDSDAGFISVDKKVSEKKQTLSKEEYQQKKARGELDNQKRGGNRNQKGGNKNQGGTRQVNNKNQGYKQGGNRNQVGEKKAAPKNETVKFVQKKDRKSRGPQSKPEKRAGKGSFNWDDPITAQAEEEIKEAVEVVPEETDVVVEAESSEEWFHEEIPEDEYELAKLNYKVINPEVKRVGLSAYLAQQAEVEAKAQELTEKLGGNIQQRTLDVVIPSSANLNKKNSQAVDDADSFLFGAKQQQKKTGKKTNQKTVNSGLEVQFRTKKHRGYNMPRERREDGDRPNRNQGYRQGGNRQGGNRNQGNRQNRKGNALKQNDFPTLGGVATLPPPTATWVAGQQ
eukprot:TRINITY_DN11_c1_g1_i1.p1 TRINITY_DN11_c1_g1~~TRINITY_DN11_c1_g1_i1.p1  ORF type:complete len:412 (-),score=136.38 TRINITY_DN11_c1_g1_i1:77-1189(-)